MAEEKWLVSGEKTIEVDAVRRLKVGLIAGQVDIVGHDEPTTRIEVHSVTGKDLKISIDGGLLEIDHPQLGWDNWIDVFKSFRGSARADVSIMVPRDVELTFGVVSASALISGLNTSGSISTVSGDVALDGITGDIQLNSVSGEISVLGHYGKISAHTISADIAATGEIIGFAGDTVSGDIFLDIEGTPSDVRTNTISGSVTTRLAPGTPAQYRINTVSGRLQLDATEIRGVRGGYTGKFGVLDEKWLDFRANSVSGNVSVLHAVTA